MYLRTVAVIAYFCMCWNRTSGVLSLYNVSHFRVYCIFIACGGRTCLQVM